MFLPSFICSNSQNNAVFDTFKMHFYFIGNDLRRYIFMRVTSCQQKAVTTFFDPFENLPKKQNVIVPG